MENIETNDKAGKIASILAKFGARTPREALGITEQDFSRMGQLGAMYYNQGDLGRARIVFEGLVEVDPQSSTAQAALGALYTRTGQDEKALEHLSSAIELDAVEISAYVNRAEVYLRLQQGEKAVADLKRAIELDPKEEDPAANRARVMALGLRQALKAKGIIN